LLYSVADPKIREFIESNLDGDPHQLLLKHREVHGIPTSFVVNQIEGRIKAKTRFPRLLSDAQIIYPPAINLEQSSSQATAEYKTDFLSKLFGRSVKQNGVDLTGGFGIDTLFLSDLFKTFDYVEKNTDLFEIATHNLSRLQPRLHFHNASAEDYLSAREEKATLVYIDPSRRDDNKQKVVKLEDCRPNVMELQDDIFRKANWLVVKTSPLLDINLAASQLKFVRAVLVLSVSNEVRELNFICQKGFRDPFIIHAADIGSNSQPLEFTRHDEEQATAELSAIAEFLYEPNAAIRKAGAFKIICSKYPVAKLHPNTHLYTSHDMIPGFPGRSFAVRAKVKSDPKQIASILGSQANVMTKNYPLTTAELKKKLKVRDGGDSFLIGFTGQGGPQLVVADRIRTKGAE
jgi:16S rRNA G966 N2-methylase RsmD